MKARSVVFYFSEKLPRKYEMNSDTSPVYLRGAVTAFGYVRCAKSRLDQGDALLAAKPKRGETVLGAVNLAEGK